MVRISDRKRLMKGKDYHPIAVCLIIEDVIDSLPPMKPILNIAAYQFVRLEALEDLRVQMLDALNSRQLKGTVLLAGEGINVFLAGAEVQLRDFLAWLRMDQRFAPIEVKESWSDDQPFKKALVKVKNEIIRMNHPAIQPCLLYTSDAADE